MGQFYYRQKDYSKAAQYLARADANALTPEEKAEANFKTGYAYFSKQQFSQALSYLKKVESNSSFAPDAAYYAAQSNYRAGNYEAALSDLRTAEKSPDYQSLAAGLKVAIYYQQKKYDKVISEGQQALKGNSADKGQIALMVAEAQYNKGNYAEAAQNYDKAKAGRDPAIAYRTGYSYLKADKPEEAIKVLKKIADRKDTTGQHAAYQLGIAYLKTGNKPFAANAFDQVLQHEENPDLQEQALFNMAKINYELGRNAEAIGMLEDYTNRFKNSENISQANELLGKAFLGSKDYVRAMAEIEKMNRRSAKVNEAYQQIAFYRGVQLFNDDKFDQAVKMFEKSLSQPLNSDLVIGAHFWMGEAEFIQKNYDQSIRHYQTVIASGQQDSPYYLKSRYGLGYAFYNKKEYDNASIHFRMYTNRLRNEQNKQNYKDALLRLADTRYVTKDYGQAVQTYDEYIDQNGSEKDYAIYQKGLTFSMMNRNEEARKSFNMLLQNFPESRYRDEALFQRAQLLYANETYAPAIAGFTELITKFPKSGLLPYAYLKRAGANFNLGNSGQASNDYKHILDNYPTHSTANSALLGLQSATQNLTEFNVYLDKFKKSNPESDALESIEFEAAKKLYFGKQYEKAITAFGNYMKNYASTGLIDEATYYLAESYYRAEQWDKAMATYKNIITRGNNSRLTKAIDRAAEIAFKQKRFAESVKYSKQLRQQARTRKEELSANIGLMESYFKLNKYDSTEYFADQILSKGNVSLGAENKALLYRGKAAFEKKNYDEAINRLLETVNAAKDENGAEAQYLIAKSLYNKKEYKQAKDALFELFNSYSNYVGWYDTGFLLLADNYTAQGEDFQAKKTLESIIENSQDEATKTLARKKLKDLESKSSKTDTTAPADTAQ